jgi:hypothetical protein
MHDGLPLRIGLIAFLAALSARGTPAQVCGAAPSLRTVGYRAGASAGVGEGTKLVSIAGAAGLLNSPLYSSASIGLVEYQRLDRTAFTTALSVGLEAPLDRLHASGLCPLVSAGTQTGPKNLQNAGIDYSDVEIGAGLALGREIRRWENGLVAVALQGLYQHVFYRYESSTGRIAGNADQSLLTLTLGVAIGRVFLRANLSQPADLKLAPTSFSCGIAIMGPTRPAVTEPPWRALPD